MNEIKRLSPPQAVTSDKIIDAIKALAGELPGAGLAMEITSWFVRTPFEKRTEEWQKTVGETLHRLATEKKIDLEELQEDDRFVDTVLQATQIALRNSQQEKREALRNAIMNSALPQAPEESERQMFLQLVDRFTVWHLKLIAFLDNPPEWCRRNNRPTLNSSITSSLSQAFELSLDELKGKSEFYEQVCSELDSAGLTNGARNLKVMMTGDGWKGSRTTPRGKEFLRFITEPPS